MERQLARLSTWAGQAGLRVGSEVGSGMNGARVKVGRLSADPDVSMVVVEHRDRLGRMNTELVEAALSASGWRLVVVLTSFCARLYGGRSAKNRAERALACVVRDLG